MSFVRTEGPSVTKRPTGANRTNYLQGFKELSFHILLRRKQPVQRRKQHNWRARAAGIHWLLT